MKQTRCIVLIDGSNFYFKLRELHLSNLLAFDFSSFIKEITLDSDNPKIMRTTYYIGKVVQTGTKKSEKMLADQQELFAHLKKHNITYSLGHLLKTDGKYHEKGVDVQIAIDMVIASYENHCDEILLVSSDTDLLPAVKVARRKGKTVTYVGFQHNPSRAMMSHCNNIFLFGKQNLKGFITNGANTRAA